ncbi:hypothetical protein M427DRAFT_132389 [Gonapodya prolifera JEL478]|uniref:Uncharacterized protein n=1 Tax=Gonapodya prolifera (strain JEL478) TaxID=1344416 RepID=A0A139AQD0_GONPJ|nr:hypothetical protein M427DRAFT_132389 [Gonapodya prolifera JEL478]|eukprot:KXS18864.1 hypothetical protein M427DRAFT_132389 [Gonapodya prolifera JEL478]
MELNAPRLNIAVKVKLATCHYTLASGQKGSWVVPKKHNIHLGNPPLTNLVEKDWNPSLKDFKMPLYVVQRRAALSLFRNILDALKRNGADGTPFLVKQHKLGTNMYLDLGRWSAVPEYRELSEDAALETIAPGGWRKRAGELKHDLVEFEAEVTPTFRHGPFSLFHQNCNGHCILEHLKTKGLKFQTIGDFYVVECTCIPGEGLANDVKVCTFTRSREDRNTMEYKDALARGEVLQVVWHDGTKVKLG